MDFLKKFFLEVGSSIHSPKFYASVAKKSFQQAFLYFLLLSLGLTLVSLVTLIHPIFIGAPKAVQNFANDITNCYPKDLEINIKNGVASSSAKQPYSVFCKGDKPLVVIDTQNPYYQQNFASSSAQAWVSKDTIYYKNSDTETRSYSLSKAKDFVLNKQVVDSFKAKLQPFLSLIGPILFVLVFLGIYLSYLLRLIYLILAAALIWALFRLFRREIEYKLAYKISLYGITLGLIVEFLVNLLSPYTHFYGFPFMVTILTLAVVYVNLLQGKEKS